MYVYINLYVHMLHRCTLICTDTHLFIYMYSDYMHTHHRYKDDDKDRGKSRVCHISKEASIGVIGSRALAWGRCFGSDRLGSKLICFGVEVAQKTPYEVCTPGKRYIHIHECMCICIYVYVYGNVHVSVFHTFMYP